MTSKTIFHVISHTHWDREWYLPFETFRLELVDLIDNLLDILEQNNDFIFHLDGQSIILQDYLEIKPDKINQIKKFVAQGNLHVGPWYVLSDQFLTSGESTIRNLLYGIRDAKKFGNVMLVGYSADQFGQIAQLPQIFKEFNITSAIIGRGIQDGFAEHTWYGLDGTSITAIALTHWYNNAQRLPEDSKSLHKYLEKIYNTQNKTSYSGHILLMNGCDHVFPQRNLPKILKTKNENQKWELRQNNLEEALKFIQGSSNREKYPIRFGEQRDDNNKYILAGTLSSRVYLKLENYKCQTKLEKIIEPLASMLSLTKKVPYPYEEVKYAWKLLMQNHAHDSICGCSIDEVHKEMEVRFAKVSQISDKIKENLLKAISYQPPSKSYYLQVINLTNLQRKEIIEAEIEFPLGPQAEHPSAAPTINKKPIESLSLKHNNKKIDVVLVDNKETYKMIRSKDDVPVLQALQKIKILFQADLEPFSVKTYEIDEQTSELVSWEASKKDRFENKSYKLSINKNGTLSITLKENNFKFENLHSLCIEDDLGDEYNFVPNPKAQSSILNPQSFIKVIEENHLRKRILLVIKGIPDIELQTEITCYKDSNRIDFKTIIDNEFKNKRIRLHFPTNLSTNYITADTPFGVIQRARPPLDWTNFAPSQPMYNWVDHSDSMQGIAFFNRGLAEYELYENGNGFAVTLLRAVGKLSSVKSHSLIETPDAQCNRKIEFNYSIYPHIGDWFNVQIHNEHLLYQIPLITNQSNTLFNISSLISTSSDLVISALKRAENKGNFYVLRLFNPTNKNIHNLNLKLNFPATNLHFLNLNEEVQDMVKEFNEDGDLVFDIKPFQILTFGIEV